MGFLNFWKQEKALTQGQDNEINQESSQQLDLFRKGELVNRERSTGATIFRKFTDSIKANGGDADAIIDSITVETEELFGCSVRELYQATGGKKKDRSTLPEIVQRSYIANEALSSFELERMEGTIGGEDQQENNENIVGTVRDVSKKTRKWLPW